MNSQKLPLQFDSASFKLRPHTCKISRNHGAHLKTKKITKNKNIESLIIYTHDNNTHTHTPTRHGLNAQIPLPVSFTACCPSSTPRPTK